MTADEAVVFVNYDSEAAAPQFVMHGAVDLLVGEPTEVQQEPEEAVCRTSIEVRLLVLIQQDDKGTTCDDEADGWA
jgi:hypothetical protein